MTTKKITRQTKDKIRFDDGRTGCQTVNHYDDGTTELVEVLVTRTAEGQQCRHVYSQCRDLMARVFGFSDLGNLSELSCGRQQFFGVKEGTRHHATRETKEETTWHE